MIQILQKQLDASTQCPLCRAAMFWVEAEFSDQELFFHQCSHCEHRLFQNDRHSCHCEACQKKRKKMMKDTRQQERRVLQSKKELEVQSLNKISFLHKLFLLALLDDVAREDVQHHEYIDWEKIKFSSISPNFQFQQRVFKQLVHEQILVPTQVIDDPSTFYINLRLDGYAEPSLFSITQRLRLWFYEDLRQGIPFKQSSEVKDSLYQMLYQEIIQFTQAVCRSWQVQFSSHISFEQLCYRLLDTLAVEQIFSLIHTALSYLQQQKALEARNDGFINTHRLKKTLLQYRERALLEKWETTNFSRPEHLPFSRMSEILYFKFLKYDQRIFSQPIQHLWRKIEPRLSFYSDKRCMHCGSNQLNVEYDAGDYVTLTCRKCQHQDHYFTQ
ncbi:hypothetical protein [Acinetobacter sp. MD2(2019)]|uniref:hypothetical protein n=1 Tax=Acinetobacter sp. MD2(2019) TaxID=2605273 RepID=UPI002D1F83E7|nr:hypothetical protein [Acinetobacter sp. MD2(2019)]MEB3754756.1 hypothetical protein [Acinetobacter sp. MD2(2019)]